MASCEKKIGEPADSPGTIDFFSIPLIAVNFAVRKRLALFLNPKSMVAANWPELAEEMGFDYLEIKNYERFDNPTGKLFEDWQVKEGSSVGRLLELLQKIERDDILEDLTPLIGSYMTSPMFKPQEENGNLKFVPQTKATVE